MMNGAHGGPRLLGDGAHRAGGGGRGHGSRGTGLDGSLAGKLASEGVYVSVRDNAIRVAPHVDNEPRDFDRLFTALLKHL